MLWLSISISGPSRRVDRLTLVEFDMLAPPNVLSPALDFVRDCAAAMPDAPEIAKFNARTKYAIRLGFMGPYMRNSRD